LHSLRLKKTGREREGRSYSSPNSLAKKNSTREEGLVEWNEILRNLYKGGQEREKKKERMTRSIAFRDCLYTNFRGGKNSDYREEGGKRYFSLVGGRGKKDGSSFLLLRACLSE